MTALEIVLSKYKGTNIESPDKTIKQEEYNALDCDCVDSDCSTETYCEGD